MTLRALAVSNLKCFVNFRLGFAPLTLLTGFNSAGKSTALQPILLLTQALRTQQISPYLSLNGPLVRLGTAGDVLANRATGREIEIIVASADEEITWQFDQVEPQERTLHVGRVIHRRNGGVERTWTEHLWLADPARESCDLIKALEGAVSISAVRGGTADAFPAPDDAGLAHANVGSEGQYAPWWYARTADDEIEEVRRHPDEPASTLRRQIDAYLGELFTGAQANADEIMRTSLVRLGLRAGTTSDWLRPANMGYGLTYAFPLLVALLLARRGQIVVIDSPEAHLHPRAQSRIGQILARFGAAGVQVLIETHSDHVLNGVRLAVRHRSIAPADVAIHFFGGVEENGGHGVTSPRLDPEGAIDAWPDGFFDQAEGDLAVLAGWE
jgi:predicted ATPase